MFEADLDKEENKDVSNAWQIVIRNYYYFRKDYDKIIRFSYLTHSKKLEEKLREFIEDPGNEILHLVEDLTENWINLDIPKIVEIRKNIDKSFLAKIRDSDNLRRKLDIMISDDIENLKSERNKLIE